VAALGALRYPHPTLGGQGCPWRNWQEGGRKGGAGGRDILFIDVKDGWRNSGRY